MQSKKVELVIQIDLGAHVVTVVENARVETGRESMLMNTLVSIPTPNEQVEQGKLNSASHETILEVD